MTEHELDTLLRDYGGAVRSVCRAILPGHPQDAEEAEADTFYKLWRGAHLPADETHRRRLVVRRSEEHTSELQSLFTISYAVFYLKKKNV